VADDLPLYDILNEFQKGHSHMAVVVKRTKEAGVSTENQKSTTADYKINPKDAHADGTHLFFLVILRWLSFTLKNVFLYTQYYSISLLLITCIFRKWMIWFWLSGSSPSYANNTAGSRRFNIEKHGDGRSCNKKSEKKRENILDFNTDPLPSYSMDEAAVGIITMEDVMEELLQVAHICNQVPMVWNKYLHCSQHNMSTMLSKYALRSPANDVVW
jgi:metal transporter CNNM